MNYTKNFTQIKTDDYIKVGISFYYLLRLF